MPGFAVASSGGLGGAMSNATIRVARPCAACHGTGSFCPHACDGGTVTVGVGAHELTRGELAALLDRRL